MTILQALSLLAGGLALLLAGVEEAAESFRSAGPGLRARLLSIARSPLESLLFGALLSGVTQSSSAAVSFAVGLTDVGLLTFRGALIVMMGASVGAAGTLFLLALDATSLAPALFAAGFLLGRIRRRGFAAGGGILRGVGLVLGGMALLRLGSAPLLILPQVRSALQGASSAPPLLFLISLALTGLLQSSSAVLALAVALVGAGALPRASVIPVALGAHVGSAAVVLLAALGRKRSARRLAAATLLYKALGALAFLPLAAPVLQGLSNVPSSLLIPLFLAALTACNALLGLPAAGSMERLSSGWFSASGGVGDPRYLDERLLPYPEVALPLLAREMARCANFVEELVGRLAAEPGGAAPSGPRGAEARTEELASGLPELIAACEEYLKELPAGGRDPRLAAEHRALSSALGPLRRIVLSVCRELPPLWRRIPRPDPELVRCFREVLTGGLSAFVTGEETGAERLRGRCALFGERVRARGEEVAEAMRDARGEALSVLLAEEEALAVAGRIASAACDLTSLSGREER